jgi:hypothetical protein
MFRLTRGFPQRNWLYDDSAEKVLHWLDSETCHGIPGDYGFI